MNCKSYSCRVALFLFVLVFIFFFPVIFQGKTFLPFDVLQEFYPWFTPEAKPNNTLITDPIQALYPIFYLGHHFYQSSLKNGSWPLWYDLNFCGKPAINYSNPLLYVFYTVFPNTIAHDLLLFILLLAIGIFTFLYLQEIEIKPAAALLGSICWMFNGYLMAWLEFKYLLTLALSLVATLYFFERILKRQRGFCFFVIAIAISICPHHHAILLIYQYIFLALYFLYRSFSIKRGFAFKKQIILAVFLLLAISANFLVFHWDLWHTSHRPSFDYASLHQKTGQVLPQYLVTFLYPNFFGNPTLHLCFIPKNFSSQIYNNYNELCIYFGVFSLFLIGPAVLHFKKKYTFFYLSVAFVTLAMAMGSFLYYPLAKIAPGFSSTTPTRSLYIFGFAIAISAALGLQEILSGITTKKKIYCTALWSALVLIALGIAVYMQTDAGIYWATQKTSLKDWLSWKETLSKHFSIYAPTIWQPLLLVILSFALLLGLLWQNGKIKRYLLILAFLVISMDLLSFASSYNTTVKRNMEYPQTPAIQFLQRDTSKFRIVHFGRFFANSFAPFHIEDIGGYDSSYPKRYGEFIQLSQKQTPMGNHIGNHMRFYQFGSPLLDILNVKYLLLPPYANIKSSSSLKLVYKGEIKIYQNLRAFDRLYWVSNYRYFKNSQNAYRALGKFSRRDFKDKVILETPPKERWQTKTQNKMKAKVDLLTYRSDYITAKVTASGGFLVLNNNYNSGWRAYINGKKVPILHANYTMMAIALPTGKKNYQIEFTYRPYGAIAGIIITLLGWLLLFIWAFYSLCVSKK